KKGYASEHLCMLIVTAEKITTGTELHWFYGQDYWKQHVQPCSICFKKPNHCKCQRTHISDNDSDSDNSTDVEDTESLNDGDSNDSSSSLSRTYSASLAL